MKLYQAMIFTSLMLWQSWATAKSDAEYAQANNLPAMTVFMDVNKLTRKNLAAKKMTKIHAEFGAAGYELVGINPYTENGDLEGFFLSYKKK
ncbi:hypothetical protein [Marinicella meishanensis]|uniref:hypothetical protein n=1 Tax=Marinicella meishanensis TaxID=2873263 RepID=UPI001CBDD953|nr:hypothetical protein [Marinicella sp. NBU2979]